VQETFLALMQKDEEPEERDIIACGAFATGAQFSAGGLWRRLTRELEARSCLKRRESESPQERAAVRCPGQTAAGTARSHRPEDLARIHVRKDWRALELSPNTVAGRYRYGLQKLRACLNGENYESLESTGEATALLDAAPTLAEP